MNLQRLTKKITKYERASGKLLIGIKKLLSDPTNIVKYLEKSCSTQSFHAELILASLYKHGIAVEKNIEKAIKYYELAEKKGFFKASLKSGKCYFKLGEEKRNLEDDITSALKYYRIAEKKGDYRASYKLGIFHLKASL